jgi:UPF0271 protein
MNRRPFEKATAMPSIDLNCDLGEAFGRWALANDAELMPEITSANLACGFHASDPITMMRSVALAKKNSVAIGAHPGLPDLLGFGRRYLLIDAEEMYSYTVYQLGAMDAMVRAAGVSLHHVKCHGALFDLIQSEPPLADAFIRAVSAVLNEPLIYWPAPLRDDALFRAAGRSGIRLVGELYADLNYRADGSIISPRHHVMIDCDESYARICRYLQTKEIATEDGSSVTIAADTIAVHGDGPNALDVLRTVRRAVADCGWELAAVA